MVLMHGLMEKNECCRGLVQRLVMAATAGVGVIQLSLSLLVVMFFLRDSIVVEGKNTPAVKSFETEYGDIYDCIDIYKQPAFDHPALKNHTIQMEPTSYPQGMSKESSSTTEVLDLGLPDGGCPKGTVPIRRIRKADVMIGKPPKRHFANATLNGPKPMLYQPPGRSHAIARTLPGEYYGTEVYMNVWNPKVDHGVDMFSLAQTWITAGSGYEVNTIEVGWLVSYSRNHDVITKMFVYWTTDGYRSTGCYNTDCPGYVQLNERIPVDYRLDHHTSTYNGQQYDVKINLFKDTRSGHWYLFRDLLPIGYWPSDVFDKLDTKADLVTWGGEVYYDVDICRRLTGSIYCPYPEMGSGHFPAEGYGKAAYMKELQVIDNKNMQYNPAKDCELINDRPDCFRITQNQKGVQVLPANHILFGGPGGYCRW
ncbi:Nep-interacting protein [Thalictrum thalictroides]|uniref:Nep-interacting protein n=1 Tax=Thalictrum thalictroides TaxID=46969 RepID=A0A7J6XD85_THATH|nr:Nep-interacting protein [Thalictrum thalictroides]